MEIAWKIKFDENFSKILLVKKYILEKELETSNFIMI